MTGITSVTLPDGVPSNPRSILQRWRDDPVAFANEAFLPDYKGRPLALAKWSADFLCSVRDNRRTSVKAGRNASKTFTLAVAAFWWALTRHPAKVLFTATRKDQLRDNNWNEAKGLAVRLIPELARCVQILSDEIRVDFSPWQPANVIQARAANRDNPVASQGAHSENMLVILDEAVGIDDAIFDVMFGSLTTPGSRWVLAGNPTLTSGWFYRTHSHPEISKQWSCFTVSSFDVKDEPWYEESFIDDARRHWGEDSWQWQAYVLGEFPTAQEGCIFPVGLVSDAVSREVVLKPGYLPIWGFDPAAGGDRCALAKRHANILLEPIQTWIAPDTQDSINRVVDQFFEAKDRGEDPAAICVDASGLGIPMAQQLRDLGLPIVPVAFSEKARRDDIYYNMRAEMHFTAAEWFKQRDCHIPYDDLLIEEMLTVRQIRSEQGNRMRLLAEPKDAVKERIGRSPDRLDAFNLTHCAKSRERDVCYIIEQKDTIRKKSMAYSPHQQGTTWMSRI